MKFYIALSTLFIPIISISAIVEKNEKIKNGKTNIIETPEGEVWVYTPRKTLGTYDKYNKNTIFITDYSKKLPEIITHTALERDLDKDNQPIIYPYFKGNIETKKSLSYLINTLKRVYAEDSLIENKNTSIISYGPVSGRISASLFCNQKELGYDIKNLFLVYPEQGSEEEYKNCNKKSDSNVIIFSDKQKNIDNLTYLNYSLGCNGLFTKQKMIDRDKTDNSIPEKIEYLCQSGEMKIYLLENTTTSWPGVGRIQGVDKIFYNNYNNDINASTIITNYSTK